MTGRDVAQAARALVGVPYEPWGRDPSKGLNCAGLLMSIGLKFGFFSQDDCAEYRKAMEGSRSLSLLRNKMTSVGISEAKTGDVVIGGTVRPEMAGVIVQDSPRRVVHVTEEGVIEDDLPRYLNITLLGAFRFKGVA